MNRGAPLVHAAPAALSVAALAVAARAAASSRQAPRCVEERALACLVRARARARARGRGRGRGRA